MKKQLVVLVVVLVVACAASTPLQLSRQEVMEILENPRVLRAYMACVMDQGPCTAEGRELRSRIPQGLRTACGDCTADQRQTVRTIVRFLRERYPEDLAMLQQQFDPSAQFADSFRSFIDADD